MKKIFLLVAIIATLCLTGCGTLGDKEIRDNFIKSSKELKSYHMEGNLKLTNNDDNYEYNVEVNYQKDNNYKVSLTNKSNNYEQIILKNNDGVYVITPSLNKSFKFQSDWPDNNSQSYLINSVAKDLEKDNDYKYTQKDNDYIFTTKTNYPNNPKYTKQNITLDKNYNLKKVEVQDNDNISYIEFSVKTIDKKATFNESEFSLEEITKNFENKEEANTENQDKSNNNTETNQNRKTQKEETNQQEDSTDQNRETTKEETSDQNRETTDTQTDTSNNQTTSDRTNKNETTNETSKVDENIFPLYLPANTTLSDKEVIETTSGERMIMTFSGENPFILVQETVKPSKDLEIIPTYGEPFMLIDTVGSLTDTSYTWTSNGVEYYIVSDQMDKKELLEVAKSINVVSTLNQK